MNLFAVSFFGHREVDDPFVIERQLESITRELLLIKEYVDFLSFTQIGILIFLVFTTR